MLRRLAFAAAATIALASARPAAADGLYFSEALGGSRYRAELARALGDDTGLHIRGAFGYKWSRFAVELYGAGELNLMSHDGYAERTSAPIGGGRIDGGLGMVGLDFKVIQPISTHWSGYVRAGLSTMMADEYSGRGINATAGVQLAGKVRALGFLAWPFFFLGVGPKVHAAVFFETGTSFHRLHAESRPSIDARIDHWTLGFAIGQDF